MIDNAFSGRLLGGERLIWTGQAGKGFVLTPFDLFLIPFSLVWTAIPLFGLLATTSSSHVASLGPFVIVPALFVAIGLFMVFGRFIVDAWLRSTTAYALTDRRVLILRQGPFGSFTTLDLAGLPELNLREKSDGSGTIRFGTSRPFGNRNGFSMLMTSTDPTPQFIAIGEVRRVFDLIQKAKAGPR